MALTAAAQNLNPTVSITNTYRTGSGENEKQTVAMSRPDSLSHFNYKFDYTVFDAPYKGAFEFTPYSVKLTPAPSESQARRLFVRAGAGYGMYPELQAIWNPLSDGNFRMNVHQDFNGYYGKYRTVRNKLDSYPMKTTKDVKHDGYDFSETFGVDGKWNMEALDACFGVDYNGIFNKDEKVANNFNSILVSAGVKSGENGWKYLAYDVNLGVDLAADAIQHPFQNRNLKQGAFTLDAVLESDIIDAFGLKVDLGLKSVNYSGADEFAYTYFGFKVAPHAVFDFGPLHLSAGVKLDGTDKLKVAPDVLATALVADGRVKFEAGVTGGTVFNTYSDFRRGCHWFYPGYSEVMRNSFEKLNVHAGVQGSLFSRLQYSLKGGWASESDMPLWAVKSVSGELSPVMSFRDCSYAYVDLLLAWKSERIDVDGAAYLKKSNLEGASDVFDLPLVSGNIRAAYNWNRRIFAGVTMNGSMARKCVVDSVPLELMGYIDLGVFGEFKVSRRFSVWLRGGNLLNEAIQLVPMHVENGINATAGICINL